VNSNDVVLIVSFIGFASQEFAVGNQNTIDAILNEDVSQLQELWLPH